MALRNATALSSKRSRLPYHLALNIQGPRRSALDPIARRKGPGDYSIIKYIEPPRLIGLPLLPALRAILFFWPRFAFNWSRLAALVHKNVCQSPSLLAHLSNLQLSTLEYLRYLIPPWRLPRFLQSSATRFYGSSSFHCCWIWWVEQQNERREVADGPDIIYLHPPAVPQTPGILPQCRVESRRIELHSQPGFRWPQCLQTILLAPNQRSL